MDSAYSSSENSSPRSPPYTPPRNPQGTPYLPTDLVHPSERGMTFFSWPGSKVTCAGGSPPSCNHCGFEPSTVARVFLGSPTWFRAPTPHAARPTSPLRGITWWFEQHGGPRIIRFCRYACLEQARKDRWDAELSEELAQSFAAISHDDTLEFMEAD
jgi:hypothetical protein